MVEYPDPLAQYAKAKGCVARSRIILVEGTTDRTLFELAAACELRITGENLLRDLCLIPAGEGDLGGTSGVIRELIGFRAVASTVLLPNGNPKYRVAALLDNDEAGRYAFRTFRQFDIRIREWSDVFLLAPVMPLTSNRDPSAIKSLIDRENAPYKGLNWEAEDLLPEDFLHAFEQEFSGAVVRRTVVQGRTHYDLTVDGKARLHRFVKMHAIHADFINVIETLRALRSYLG
jgi:hypothetical protein